MDGCEHFKNVFIAKFCLWKFPINQCCNSWWFSWGGDAWWLLSPTNQQNAEYFRKLHMFVCTFTTFRLHRILLAKLHVLLGLRSYAHMSNSKFKGLCSTSLIWNHKYDCTKRSLNTTLLHPVWNGKIQFLRYRTF